ncbi:MAG: ATP-binding protein [Desulfovibrio sp.]|jgi:anti-anti-sigma factor|nr:ATP-binding protein [Desulfovibrio sp.]
MSLELPGLRRSGEGIAFDFPATTENVEVFIAAIHGFLAEESLGSLTFDMELLAREALANAVQHGSGGDPGKTVSASLRRTPGALELTVVDQGPGWNWRALEPARQEPPDPAGESGRGLFIIRKYSDTFAYNETGNALTIFKRLPAEEQHMSTTNEGAVRLVMEPRIVAQEVPALRELFRSHLQAGVCRLELDFERVESLDSMGIGLLVATHNSLAKKGGALSLTGVRKDIHQLLCLMRLDKHFSIAPCGEA